MKTTAEALFDRLSRVKPVVSFGIGFPLGVGAKRLLLTVLAATTIATGGLSRAENATLGGVYVALATIVVWVPVAVYLVLGSRADGLVARARRSVTTHEDQVTTFAALALGVLLIGDALLELAV